ncbi:MAG: presqualene diphosphate synthase HpnD [Geminicoccaceae bacterium]
MDAAQAAASMDAAQAAARHVEAVVRRSGTSFYWAMRLLPEARRQAMYAIYAFCREVDDIADEPGEVAAKLAGLEGWRDEIAALYAGRPRLPTAVALHAAVRRFDLPRAELLAVIDGMAMDAREQMRAPDLATLVLYCRRVAGAVGLLSIHAFGTRSALAPEFAVALGEALQLTNILRDLDEDAERDRLYLPAELLASAGVAAATPATALAHPALPLACETLAERAALRFAEADRLRRAEPDPALRPAILMMKVYERMLARLRARGFAAPRPPVRIPKPERAWIALRYSLLGA